MKKRTKTFLFRSMTVLAAGALLFAPGCKDYQDDIDRLDQEVGTLKTDLSELKSKVNNGKTITDVQPVTNGFRISFSDNTSYEIVSGTQTAGTVVKVDKNGHLWIDNADCGKVVNEEISEPEKVTVSIDKDGYICVNGEKQTDARISFDANKSYAVEHEDYVEFYIADNTGKMPESPVKIWKNAALTGLLTIPHQLAGAADPSLFRGNGLLFPTIYGIDDQGNYVRLYAGKAKIQYEINPKSAAVEVTGYATRRIATRAAGRGIVLSPEPVCENGILTVEAKAMDGLYSYNHLGALKNYIYYWNTENIDPLVNMVALKAKSNEGEELISDYVLGFDYNISRENVSLRKKTTTGNGETEWEDNLAATGDQAKESSRKADFELLYNNGEGSLDLSERIRAYFTRTGLTGQKGDFEFTQNGFDEHAITFEKVPFEFSDGTHKEDHGSYINLTQEGIVTVNEEADEKGSAISRTPIVKIILTSDAGTNHGKTVKTAYAKIKIVDKTEEKEIPAYEQTFGYELNDEGTAKTLQLDKLYGHVAGHLGILGSDKFHTIYTSFSQIYTDPADPAKTYDSEIVIRPTTQTSTGNQEWLEVSVPNYKKAGQYKVKGVYKSTNDQVYPPVYVIYTVDVTYPAGPYLTKATDPDDGSGNFWESGKLIVNGKFAADGRFEMKGKISNAFIYTLPYDTNPFDNLLWDKTANDKNNLAKVNIEYTLADNSDAATARFEDDAANTTLWLGNLYIDKITDNADYRDVKVTPVTWYNLNLEKQVNGTPLTPAAAISKADGLKNITEESFLVSFISPLKALSAKNGVLDANSTVDQSLDLLKDVQVYDRYGKVIYKDKTFRTVNANGTDYSADHVYRISAPVFSWADQATERFVETMKQRGIKCELNPGTGVISFKASGEVGIVNLKVKVSMASPWRLLESIITVSVK